MRIAPIALTFLVSTALHSSVNAQAVIKAPNAVTRDEYMKLLSSVPELPGIVNEDLLKLSAYHGWGVGYIQGNDPNLFPALIKHYSENIALVEEFGFYIDFVSSVYSGHCRSVEP